VEQRLDVGPFAGGNDDGVDLGPGDDGGVVARVELRARLLREIARLGRLGIGNRQELDSGMLRCQARAQRADTAGTDDGDAQLLALDGRLLERADILAGAFRRKPAAQVGRRKSEGGSRNRQAKLHSPFDFRISTCF